ncbi:hypothetical protein Q8F57_000600 [Paraburkholderia terrae]|uniref:hypothetical protein n=1 Tax=Paraburkholderia terrae TaxID=311230 RepID=UPI00296B3C63|nr:hypothetical protein [Paraburkholderia terrae]MDW3663471.1 hypothetical protein [Paraburkholderia terrae]
MDYESQIEQAKRAQRLASCGFECFANPAAPDDKELRWAEFEFQVYSLAANTLAVKTAGTYIQSPSAICDAIRQVVSGLPLASPWSAQWEAALDLWCKTPDPPNDAGHYVCPVLIERVTVALDTDGNETRAPDEFSRPGPVDRSNVWSLSRGDAGRHFFVRDFSGMFTFATSDPAYKAAGYVAPTGLTQPDWLYAQGRCFMKAKSWSREGVYVDTGVGVDPWIAMELLPGALQDAARIQGDSQWRSLFRIVRAIAEIEAEGYYDGLQGYDEGNISIPLLHFTGPTKDKHGWSELGGFIASLAIHDQAVHQAFRRFGLTHTGRGWSDTGGWGAAYECDSGRAQTVVGRFITDAGISGAVREPSVEQRRFWRRPHFHYRVAMLCRTQPALREAMWRAAVQRVRNVAWTDVRSMALPDRLSERVWLGRVLTSELALAIVARLHVFYPESAFGSSMAKIITASWNDALRDGYVDDRLQANFEERFCRHFDDVAKTAWSGSSVDRLASWPASEAVGRAYRLKVADLYPGPGAPSAVPPLSEAVRSSPMFAGVRFLDPLEGHEWSEANPVTPMHLTAATGRFVAGATEADDARTLADAFRDMGVGVRLPQGHAGVGDAVSRQRTREALGALTAKYLLVGTVPELNLWRHALRPVADARQRWASLMLWRMWDARAVSALRVGTDPVTAPLPANSRWQLFDPDLVQRTLHVFDQRESTAVNAIALATVDAQGKLVTSSGTVPECAIAGGAAAQFGVNAGDALQHKSFGIFVRAMREGMQLQAIDDFSVSRDATNYTLRFAWLTQSFARAGGPAVPGDFAFYLEYLGWLGSRIERKDQVWSDGPFGRHLRPLGLDLWGATWKGQGDFFRQKWPRAALPANGARPGDLSPRTIARLWNPGKLARTDSTELAAALLSWPSLYRVRAMLRVELLARRALYDLWRMRVRGALSLPLQGLKGAWSTIPRAWQLFQTTETLCALAHWALADAPDLMKATASTTLRKRATDWFAAHQGTSSDHTQWNSIERCQFLREVLVPGAREAAMRARLLDLAPVPAAADGAPWCTELGQVFDLGELATSGAPVSADISHAVMLPVAALSAVGVGVLADALPQPPHAFAAASDRYSVSGLVFSLPGVGAVPLLLPEPVEVVLSNVVPGGQFDMYWTRDGSDVQKAFPYDQAQPGDEWRLSADVSSWLGDLGDAISLTVELEAKNEAAGFELTAGLVLAAPWLSAPVALRARVAELKAIALHNGELVWTVPLNQLVEGLDRIIPVHVDRDATLTLSVSLSATLTPVVRLRIGTKRLQLPLGSPAAILAIEAAAPWDIDVDLTGGTAHAGLPQAVTLSLDFLLAISTGGRTRIVPTEGNEATFRIPLGTINTAALALAGPGGAVPAQPVRINLSRPDLPGVPVSLLQAGVPALLQGKSRLLDVAGQWLAGGAALMSELINAATPLTPLVGAGRFGFRLGTELALGPLTAPLSFDCSCPVLNGELDLAHGFSFTAGAATITFTPPGNATLPLGPMANLALPPTLTAILDFSGEADLVQFQLGAQPIVLRIPASTGFEFDIDALSLGRAGLSLHATVRAGSQSLGKLPSLDEALVVESARDGVGELSIHHGRLTGASLRARARLTLFDDADGVLTVRMLADDEGLGVLADLDIGVQRVFHIRPLFLQVQVERVSFGLSWRAKDGWQARGGLTGSMRFVPEGELTSRLAEYRGLFDAASVHFENLDLQDLRTASLVVQVTPREFKVASILQVVWRGFVLVPPDAAGRRSIRLLGDAAFTVEFPGLQAQLSLGDITVSQPDASSFVPSARITSIGIQLRVDGGFRFAGSIEEYDNEQEFGIGGTVSLESGFIPPASVMLKLTRIRDQGQILPSIAVFGEIQRDDHLGYGFFLRRVGLGVGVRQHLRGFSDASPANATIAQRVQHAVDSPTGLPYPGSTEAWVPAPPSSGAPQNLLVGYGLVSFGLLPMDRDHPFVGSLVIAIDERLSIVAGLNAWFLVSPEAAKTPEFLQRPAVKGALGFSPREQILFARFVTLKDPAFGPSARGNLIGSLLRDALKSCLLPAALYADAHGAIVEVAWPRQAHFEADLGPAHGVVEAGFRFGYYRGAHAIGLNLKAQAELGGGLDADLGFANVSVHARASFELVASFGGAITPSGQLYALAELVVSAALELSVHVWKTIHVDGFLCSFDVTLFDVSAGLALTVSANLSAAIVPDGLGFEGSARVSLHVAGFGFEVSVRVGASEGRIGEARRVISELMPPIDDLIRAGNTLRAKARLAHGVAAPAWAPPALPVSTLAHALPGGLAGGPALPAQWRYFPVRVGDQLRVVLFPDGDARACYPRPTSQSPGVFAPRYHRWRLVAGASAAWRGLVGRAFSGSVAAGIDVLEGAWQDLLPLAWMQKRNAQARRSVTVGDLLMTLEQTLPEFVEIVDPRTQRPVDGDFDDPAVTAMPGRRSTHFRRRSGTGTYDEHLAQAALHAQVSPTAPPVTVMQQGELLMQLLALARDASAQAALEIPALDGNVPDGRRLAAQLGLVLSFEDPVDAVTGRGALEAAIASTGMVALFEPASLKLFDQPIDPGTILPPVNPNEQHHINRGYDFQGTGEIGLVWSVSRTKDDGTIACDGPCSHTGIETFRVTRTQKSGPPVPFAPPVWLRPGWLTYPCGDGRIFAVRPQFQFIDRGLPTQLGGEVTFEYTVEAFACGTGVKLTDQKLYASYWPASQPFAIQHAQVLLRLLPATCVVQCDVAVSGFSDKDPMVSVVESRLCLRRRDAQPEVLGRYGDGLDLALSLSAGLAVQGADGLRVKLPQPDQMRQLAAEDLLALPEVRLTWSRAGVLKDGVQHFTALVTIGRNTEDARWRELLGTADAGEFHVYVAGDPTVAQLDSPAFRLRHAVRFDPPSAVAAQQDTPAPAPGLFSEGSEVSLLERVPLAAAAPAAREYLPVNRASFSAEVAHVSFAPDATMPAGDITPRVVSRLRGVISLPPDAGNALGPVIGLRVWARDTMGAGLPTRQIAQFTLQPEAVYRALPASVTPRPLPGPLPVPGGEVALDWRPETEPLCAYWKKPAPPVPPKPDPQVALTEFAAIEDVHARPVLLHNSLINALGELEAVAAQCPAKTTVCVSVDEPLLARPATAPRGQRIGQLLSRADVSTDPAGWRLIEALGGSVTCWFERAGEPVDPREWMSRKDVLSNQEVVLVSFTRFAPGERPHGRTRLQWRVRLFALPVLQEVDGLRKASYAEVLQGGALFEALREIDPDPYQPASGTAPPIAWANLLDALAERASRLLGGKDPSGRRLFWQVAPAPVVNDAGGGADPVAADLPLLDGQAHCFHGLDEGYAQALEVWVEVVRRYQFATRPLDPEAGAPAGATHKVTVARTLPLAPDRWVAGTDAASGAVCALVAVHPAQRAQLARNDLALRTQFVAQRVALRRRIAKADMLAWRALLGKVPDFDAAAWQASWAMAKNDTTTPHDWLLPEHGLAHIVRGSDRYRYPHLPAAWRYAVSVSTQAGVRESREAPHGVEERWLAPVFVKDGDLAYAPPDLSVRTADDGRLEIEFALVRAADSLDPVSWPVQQRSCVQAVLNYWLRHDEPIPQAGGGRAEEADGVPRMIMQLPDLNAIYVLVAQDTETPVTLEIARIALATGEPTGVSARLLVQPYQAVAASLGQVEHGAQAGRLCARLNLELALPELAWLRGMSDGASRWILRIAVDRDGTRYGAQP